MNIAFDSHKRYTLCSVADDRGLVLEEERIEHVRGAIVSYLSRFPSGESVAVETIGNWYWIVDEIEAAGLKPLLVHARKAKLMMGCINKTDQLDVRGLNRLQQTGALPTVWIPSGELRDWRDLPRTRMYFGAIRTRLKNRLHASLAKYAQTVQGVSDIFGPRSREALLVHLDYLPEQTRFTTLEQLAYIDRLTESIKGIDARMDDIFTETQDVSLVRTAPGIGFVLGIVIALEVGDVTRFASPGRLASYSGTVPRVRASGGRISYGRLRPDVNRYLKWAYSEAANSICINRHLWPDRHVAQLYTRLREKKGHGTAIGAVARHLAEATYWMLKKKEPYRDPNVKHAASTRV
ncbi:MAG: IS110 family transposase [candidate division Zixibacteria bacterium]|nr:IS110 family transposase [candidate division Zixibacteria bacterium]MBU1469637.1 IS110 family transposase [candidate division Zixibacteria bacterium]